MDRRAMLKSTVIGLAAVALGTSTLMVEGCGVAVATWVTLGMNLLTTVLPTIPGLIASFSSLAGKTITAAQLAKLTSIFSGVQNLFSQAEQDLQAFQASNDPTLVAKVRDLLTQIQSQLAATLTDVGVTDPATVTKIQAAVNAFIGLAASILAVLPVVSNGKLSAKRVTKDQIAAIQPDVWATRFNTTIHAPTGNLVVDEAFAKVVAVPQK